MEDPSTPELPSISPSISMELMMYTCKTLTRVIQPQDKDDWILQSLWRPVNDMLEQDRTLKLATKDEFAGKVNNYPGGDFIGKVKNIAIASQKSITNWGSLFSDGMYFIFSACSAPIISHI